MCVWAYAIGYIACIFKGVTHEEWLEQHDRMLADADLRRERDNAELRAGYARLQASQEKTELALRRAVRLAVQDARRQRRVNAEFDLKMTQIVSAQLINEELLKRFLQRGGNGQH